jgi:uncharacterized protein
VSAESVSQRPVPVPTEISQPHWQGCRAGELLVQQCDQCATYLFPPEQYCHRCLSPDLTWVRSSGLGNVHTFSTVWRPQQPAFSVPYVAAVVQLEEGWYMWTNLIDCDPADVFIDMPVEVAFVEVGADTTLPMFRPHSPGPGCRSGP